MINEDYVSYETAKLLKEKGFDEATIGYYYTISEIPEKIKFFDSPISIYDSEGLIGCIQAPTLQMAMKWLRELHNIFIAINIIPNIPEAIEDKRCYFFKPYKNRLIHNFPLNYSIEIYSTYEEACEEAIKYCLKNLI